MASCDIQTLLSKNPCLGGAPDWIVELVEFQILCGIKNFLTLGTPVTCNIQSLLNDAACANAIDSGLLKVAKIQLLCDISVLIAGGGGVAGFLCGVGNPNGVVASVVCGQLYTDTATGAKYTSTVSGTNNNWV